MKKLKEEGIKFCHAFGTGDLCANQDKDIVIITEAKNGVYKFMNLKDKSIKCIGETLYVKKGSISTQPCDIFDKHYYLYQIK